MTILLTSCVLLLLVGVAHSQELKYALFTSGPTGSFDSSGAVPAIELTSGSTGSFDSSGAVPAIELAEELINADSSILPGYNLTHTPVVDTEVGYSYGSAISSIICNMDLDCSP